jgi:hypothetical protein
MGDPMVDVFDIRSTSRVLVFGRATYPGLESMCGELVFAKTAKELAELDEAGECFDRIIVDRSTTTNENAMRRLAGMNRGLLCVFVNSQVEQDEYEKYLIHKHPWHAVWALDTKVGRALVTDATGPQEWLD